MSKICQYCGSEKQADGARCTRCGAASFGDAPPPQFRKGEPFHYNGYVVWWIENVMRPCPAVEFLFYLGDKLIERIVLDREVIRLLVPEHCDAMPFIWDLFKLAQGEEEVVRITEQNTTRPVVFRITVETSPEYEWAIGLTRNDVYTAIATGERELTYSHA